MTRSIAGLAETISSKPTEPERDLRPARAFTSRWSSFIAFEIEVAMRSGETGLTTKSKAPARIACTTVSIPPCPVCTMTGICVPNS